ncbi:accessory factor UbiK family protein [Sphingomonas montana]|uniref:accessory factor UbiK family protein n=1 Tax=Sphingomonas montana TaxID=1843236 RepID=UPI0009F87848|nr:accessory factor UbiK family protein [Sphingomonas montana]
MQTENRFIDDIVKMMNGAAGTLAGVGREAESSARSRAREWIGGLDFVSRDEFEAVKAMAAAARDEADVLRARLDALEAKSAASAPVTPAAPTTDTVAPHGTVQGQSQTQSFGGTDGGPVAQS